MLIKRPEERLDEIEEEEAAANHSSGRKQDATMHTLATIVNNDPSTIHVRVKRTDYGRSGAPLPQYQTVEAAGMDLCAAIEEAITLEPRGRAQIPTGIAMAIPPGYEGQIRPRSGLAAKYGVTVLNAPGTVDSDYRGEIVVLLVNLSSAPVTIQPGDRIAQIVFARHEVARLIEVDDLDETVRGMGGLGSTGR